MKRVFKLSKAQTNALLEVAVGPGKGNSVPTPKVPERSGRFRLKVKDMPTEEERKLKEAPMEFSLEAWPAMLARMAVDPEYNQDVLWHLRNKMSRTDPHRTSIAGRSAAKVPMLNADPDSIKQGLDYREVSRKTHLPKGAVALRLVVKPTSSKTAKLGMNSACWSERSWTVYTLRYAKGFVIVTDLGMESKVFSNIGQLKSAIRKSGWEIIR